MHAVDEGQRGRLADVVGARLEGQSPHGDRLSLQLAGEMLLGLARQHVLLPQVDLVHGVEDLRPDAQLPGGGREGLHVLGEATAAIAAAREQEGKADAAVVADAAADLVDVGPRQLAQVGHLVDEADLRRQQGVGHVLGHLGAFGRHDQQRLVGPQVRGIQLGHHLDDLGAAGCR